MQQFQKKQAMLGFTLVEVLVASAILAVGLIGAASMVSRSTTQDARSYYMTRGGLMVEEFLENATLRQYTKTEYQNMAGTAWNRTIDGVQYSTDCVLTGNVPIQNCKTMNCTVSWNNKGLAARTSYIYVYAPKYNYAN